MKLLHILIFKIWVKARQEEVVTYEVPGQPGLHRVTLLQKNKICKKCLKLPVLMPTTFWDLALTWLLTGAHVFPSWKAQG